MFNPGFLVKSFLSALLSLRFLSHEGNATMVNLLLPFVLFHNKSDYCSDLSIAFAFDEM